MMYNNQPVAAKRPTPKPAPKLATQPQQVATKVKRKKRKKVWESPDDVAFGKALQEKWARRKQGKL